VEIDMRNIIILITAVLVTSLTTAEASDKHLHIKAAHAPRATHATGHFGFHQRSYIYGSSYYENDSVDSDYDACQPDIVHVSDKPIVDILTNVFIQGVAAYGCSGGFEQPADSGGPVPERETRCHSRIGAVDNDSEFDHRFVNYAVWQTENPQTSTLVRPLAATEPARQSGNFASTDNDPPTRVEVAVIESDDDQQPDRAELQWCETAER
jgi:hypothetical protein